MKRIFIRPGKIAIVDNEDFEYLSKYSWFIQDNSCTYYARCSLPINGKPKISMHRLIMIIHGRDIKNKCIDHVNHNGLDNRKSNIRICSNSENNRNKTKNHSNQYYKGVAWVDRLKKWKASIGINGKSINLGHYKSGILAAKVYDTAARMYFGDFAKCNFPRCKKIYPPQKRTKTSSHKNVYIDRKSGKWIALFYENRKKFYIGRFEKEQDAISALNSNENYKNREAE